MARFIAVLRAVNVGGTGKLPMKDFKSACEEAGLLKVSTYIASGNLLFDHDGTAEQARDIVTTVLRERFGLVKNHPILRTPKQLAAALAANPFADAAQERPKQLLLYFLAAVPPAGTAEKLKGWTGPERLHLDGDCLYVDFTEGVAKSKLAPAALDRLLTVPATARNWNTANTLLELATQ